MRLNWFLSHRAAGERGLLRGALGLLGPSWRRAPLWRLSQTLCLAGFIVLFLWVCEPDMTRRDPRITEPVDVETFLLLDPLAGTSAALAARAGMRALLWAAGILLVCLVIPRGFCAYVCPMGTLIDLQDRLVGRWFRRLHVKRRGGWAHLKYYVLAAVLVSSVAGVVIAPLVAAIPVLTRAMQFIVAPVQLAATRGDHLVEDLTTAQWVSIALFGAIFALTVLGPRFWCRFLCPTGAMFSVTNFLRRTDRKVTAGCVECGDCATACDFDAIRDDYTTRGADCTFCQSCGGACPVGAIQFTNRGAVVDAKVPADPPPRETSLSRRGFIAATAGGVGAALGLGPLSSTLGLAAPGAPVRPPGSAPEETFLDLCVRCGTCMKACGANLLQPQGAAGGLAGLWTPVAATDLSGCDPACNNCGQVCPTEAIRPLPLEQKRTTRMGLAVVNEKTCLPHANRKACQMCVDTCKAAGYEAIEFLRVHVEVDEMGMPLEDSGYLAPVVLADKCVGCGLCQSRCYRINDLEKSILKGSAICVETGEGKEDRR